MTLQICEEQIGFARQILGEAALDQALSPNPFSASTAEMSLVTGSLSSILSEPLNVTRRGQESCSVLEQLCFSPQNGTM